jgi:hypothetical protein
MTDGGDHGEPAGGNGTSNALAVEGGKVFEGAASAGEDNEVDWRGTVEGGVIELVDRGFDFGGGLVALDRDWDKENAQAGVTAGDDVEEVANDGAGGGSDDADGARKCRERALTGGVEEAFGLKAFFELLEGELKGAGADGLHGFSDELELSALLVDADAAADEDVEAIFGAKAEEDGLATEENDGQLGVSVFEREVEMSGRGRAVVGDFAFNPDVAVLLLDEFTDLGDKFADGPDAALMMWLVEGEIELRREWVGRCHQEKFTRYCMEQTLAIRSQRILKSSKDGHLMTRLAISPWQTSATSRRVERQRGGGRRELPYLRRRGQVPV